MLIVDNTTLIHVDSTSDIIEHYGTKGMKWGKRIAGSWAGQHVKNYANTVRHPIRQSRAYAALESRSGMPIVGTKRQLKFLNNHVAAQNAAGKQLSLDKRSAKNSFKDKKKAIKAELRKKTYRQKLQELQKDEKNYKQERKSMKKDYKNKLKALKNDRKNNINLAISKYRNIGNNVVY